MHLVDHARAHVEKTYVRPLPDRLLRSALAFVLARPGWFRLGLTALGASAAVQSFPAEAPRRDAGARPGQNSQRLRRRPPANFARAGRRKMRVALLNGCAQQALDPAINEATVRLLTRFGVEVVVAEGAGCCGALAHHLAGPRPRGNSRREHRRLDARDREGRARPDRHQHIGLRHDGQRLRFSVPRRPGASRSGGACRGDRPRRQRGPGRA